MTNVQVRDVPPEVVELLKARAAGQQKSLQSYLLDVLKTDAGAETNRQLLELAARHATYAGDWDETVEFIHRAREERDARLT